MSKFKELIAKRESQITGEPEENILKRFKRQEEDNRKREKYDLLIKQQVLMHTKQNYWIIGLTIILIILTFILLYLNLK